MLSHGIDQDKEEVKKALAGSKLCEQLNSHEINMLLDHSALIHYKVGDFIFQQGQILNGMYIIIDGIALMTAKILGESALNMSTLGRGDFFGEISLIERLPAATSIIASSQVRCLFISIYYFDMLSLFFPETKHKLSVAITQGITSRIELMYIKIIEYMRETHMHIRSVFGEVIRSFTYPTTIGIEQVGLSRETILKLPIFASFNPAEVELLLAHSTFIKATKHCQLLQENKNNDVFLIIFGAVQLSIIEGNKVAKIAVLGPMELFCSLSLIKENLASYINYVSCERVIIIKIAEDNLQHLKKHHHLLWYKLFDLICKSFVALEGSLDKLNIRLNSELYNR